jgi:hypothetical protein
MRESPCNDTIHKLQYTTVASPSVSTTHTYTLHPNMESNPTNTSEQSRKIIRIIRRSSEGLETIDLKVRVEGTQGSPTHDEKFSRTWPSDTNLPQLSTEVNTFFDEHGEVDEPSWNPKTIPTMLKRAKTFLRHGENVSMWVSNLTGDAKDLIKNEKLSSDQGLNAVVGVAGLSVKISDKQGVSTMDKLWAKSDLDNARTILGKGSGLESENAPSSL